MLSWSCNELDVQVDFRALAAGEGDVGVPFSDELMAFANAAADLRGDAGEMRAARDALVAAVGEAMMVDAAAVAGNFQMMTRLADGTGAQVTEARRAQGARAIEVMGLDAMPSRR